MREFHLVKDDGGLFSPPSVRVSTIRLPVSLPDGRYETCVFAGDESEVVARYHDMLSALIGHYRFSRRYLKGA